jgi:transaldolase/glucose-6-phosphate isomerase
MRLRQLGGRSSVYRDTLYVEALIGRDTVNTMPPATLDAVRNHGIITPDAIQQYVDGARHVIAAVEEHGIRLNDIMDQLVVDGVKLFYDAFDKLLGAIEAQRRKLAG